MSRHDCCWHLGCILPLSADVWVAFFREWSVISPLRTGSIDNLIGPPVGILGEGQLTGALRKCPSAVVLLDEFEKAHPRVSCHSYRWDLGCILLKMPAI